MRFTFTCLLIVLSLGLTACGSSHKRPHVNFQGAAYWQRINVQESVYLTGARAQKILNRHIAKCTADVKALQTSNPLREAIPADVAPYEDADTRHLKQWDSPERDRYLRLEHSDYHDFESCMEHHGWRRIQTLTQEDIKRSQNNYLDYREGSQYTNNPKAIEKQMEERRSRSSSSSSGGGSYFSF